MQCVAACCCVLQCVAVCCSVLQGVAVRCSDLDLPLNNGLECIEGREIYRRDMEKLINKRLRNMCTQWLVAGCCNVLQCVAVWCSVLQCAAVCCSVLQCVAVCCSALQCVAVSCSVLQYRNVSSEHGETDQ